MMTNFYNTFYPSMKELKVLKNGILGKNTALLCYLTAIILLICELFLIFDNYFSLEHIMNYFTEKWTIMKS